MPPDPNFVNVAVGGLIRGARSVLGLNEDDIYVELAKRDTDTNG